MFAASAKHFEGISNFHFVLIALNLEFITVLFNKSSINVDFVHNFLLMDYYTVKVFLLRLARLTNRTL